MNATFSELLRAFTRIGFLSFGGPAAQIAVMHKELVEERPWLTEQQFLNALSFCMLLPGPEAMQLATYCGWRLRGVVGGLIAGLLFVVPGAVVMLVLAGLYAWFGNVPLAAALFLGIKATVVIIVIEALLKVSKKALKSADKWIIAALSFIAIFAFHIPFPLIIIAAALYGWLTSAATAEHAPPIAQANTLRTVAVWGVLWWAPIGVLWLTGQELLTQIGLFFSKLAIVDGLGLAETTPGPLILVTEFVAFLAGFGAGGMGMAIAAGLLAVWVTFVPCFLWIFAGAPYIDWVSTRPRFAGALQAITAAVVGVILNLSLWFATHVFFGSVSTTKFGPLQLLSPDLSTLDIRATILALLAGFALLWLKWGLIRVLILAALLGVGFGMV